MIIHADCKTCGVQFHYERHSGGGALRKYCDQHSYSDSAVAARNEGRCCVVCGTDISSRHGTAIVCSRECSKRRVSDLKKERRKFTAKVVRSACKECGSEFFYIKTWKGNNREICSDECKDAIYRGRLADLREKSAERLRKEAFKQFDEKASKIKQKADSLRRECTYCGVTFTPVGYNSRGHFTGFPKRTMCGKGCSTKAAADAAREKNLGMRAGDDRYPEARLRSDMVRREITAIRRIASRKGVNRPPIRCDSCGTPFRPIYTWHRYCGPTCRDQDARNKEWDSRRGVVKSCAWCGVEWCATKDATVAHGFCSDECRDNRARQYKRDSKRKRSARIKEGYSEFVDRLKVFDRDGWQCNACGCDTPRDMLGLMEDDAPELDHVVPLAAGGDHSYENTQLLCRMCNWMKGTMMMSDFIKKHGLGSVDKTMG